MRYIRLFKEFIRTCGDFKAYQAYKMEKQTLKWRTRMHKLPDFASILVGTRSVPIILVVSLS